MTNPRILHDSRFDDGTVVGSTEAAGFPAANIVEWRPYKEWRPTAMPATLTVDAAVAKAADYALIWSHDLFTKGVTVEVRGSTDNFAASNVLLATKTPGDDKPFAVYFNAQSFRYWRLRFTTGTAPTIGIAAIGSRLVMFRPLGAGFDPSGREPKGVFSRSVAGHGLGRTLQYEDWSETLRFPDVTWAWLRGDWEPAWDGHLRSTPFVFDWFPEDATHGTEIRLVNAPGGYSSPHKPGSYTDLSFDVIGAF